MIKQRKKKRKDLKQKIHKFMTHNGMLNEKLIIRSLKLSFLIKSQKLIFEVG